VNAARRAPQARAWRPEADGPGYLSPMRPRCALIAVLVPALAAAVPVQAAVAQADELPPPRVGVFPPPRTISASATTQFSFRGVPRERLGTIRVRGSRSGNHSGRLRAHSDGNGASFVSNRRFRVNELVTVRTALSIPGVRNGDFRVRIAGERNVDIGRQGIPPPPRVPLKTRSFRSRPDLRPALVTVEQRSAGASPGYLFLGPKQRAARGQKGPMILDDAGEPIWFRPLKGPLQPFDVRAQSFRGRPVLTWWEGRSRFGEGRGVNVIVDDRYRRIARVQAGNGYEADQHEFLLTDRGTAIVVVYQPVRRDLSSVRGAVHGTVTDSIVQEIDVDTGLVLFEWHSLGTVGLRESYGPPPDTGRLSYDYFHVNSVDVDADGDLLISARDTWAVYKLDRESGAVVWRLGGKRSDFRMGRGTSFAWQHDARRQADGTLTLFDNAAAPPVRKRSRALVLAVDERARRASLVRSTVHPRGLLAANQGNANRQPNGNVLVGWGSQRYLSEHTPDGRVVFNARFALGSESYRAFRSPWTGRPLTRPRIAAAARGAGQLSLYASWNGATEVATWEVLGGARPDALAPLGTLARTGFETAMRVRTQTPWIAARAKDAAGAVLGTSRAIRAPG